MTTKGTTWEKIFLSVLISTYIPLCPIYIKFVFTGREIKGHGKCSYYTTLKLDFQGSTGSHTLKPWRDQNSRKTEGNFRWSASAALITFISHFRSITTVNVCCADYCFMKYHIYPHLLRCCWRLKSLFLGEIGLLLCRRQGIVWASADLQTIHLPHGRRRHRTYRYIRNEKKWIYPHKLNES